MMRRIIRLVILSALSVLSMLVSANSQPGFKGGFSSIPPWLQQQMQMRGNSWRQGCPVSLNQLSYLTVSYWGFDNKSHIGHIIINKQLAAEVVQIFEELYQHHFLIENMQLPSQHHSSARDDDSHGFECYQDPENKSQFSMHAYGIAIDINPVYNPYEKTPGYAYPTNGQKFLDRSLTHRGMVKINGPVFNAFIKRGWIWGGFSQKRDYMHFRKVLTPYYRVDKMRYVSPSVRIKSLPNL